MSMNINLMQLIQMIESASQEEKQLLQKKIALLATKINV